VTQAFLLDASPDLAIIDLEMPRLGGYSTAVALRAVEQAFDRVPIPVLCFSAHSGDDAFRKALDTVGSATYLNKGGGGGLDELFNRLAQVLRTFRGQAALG